MLQISAELRYVRFDAADKRMLKIMEMDGPNLVKKMHLLF